MVDLTNFESALQAKFDELTTGSPDKDFLLLGKAFEAALRPPKSAGGTAATTAVAPAGGITAINAQDALQDLDTGKQSVSEKNAPNGYAGLDALGKVLAERLPEVVLGAMRYQGLWDAAANSPAIPTASNENRGWYYVVSTNGATDIGGVTDWKVGDWIVSSGVGWDKIDSSDQVTAVAGLVGNITKEALKVALELGIADITGLIDVFVGISDDLQTKALKTQVVPRGEFITVDQTVSRPCQPFDTIYCIAGSPILTLPDSPLVNDQVLVIRRGSGDITIARNGKTIAGDAEDFVINQDKRSTQLLWSGSTWIVFGGSVA
jgi:hypothetical protein